MTVEKSKKVLFLRFRIWPACKKQLNCFWSNSFVIQPFYFFLSFFRPLYSRLTLWFIVSYTWIDQHVANMPLAEQRQIDGCHGAIILGTNDAINESLTTLWSNRSCGILFNHAISFKLKILLLGITYMLLSGSSKYFAMFARLKPIVRSRQGHRYTTSSLADNTRCRWSTKHPTMCLLFFLRLQPMLEKQITNYFSMLENHSTRHFFWKAVKSVNHYQLELHKSQFFTPWWAWRGSAVFGFLRAPAWLPDEATRYI